MSTPAAPTLAPLAEDFRIAWRGLGSTVTLIATQHEGVRYAMLATAVTSVSMDPPSLLICVNSDAGAHDALLARGAFSLGLIGVAQAETAGHIARAKGEARFEAGRWEIEDAKGSPIDGLPYLADAQSTIMCITDAVHRYGTHSILIAQVAGVEQGADAVDPLLYCSGRYGRFSPELG